MKRGIDLLRSRLVLVTRELVREAKQDRVLGLAAEVAFFAVFSLFPGLLIAVGLTGFLDVLAGSDLAAEARRRTVDALETVLTESAAPLVSSVEGVFEGHYGGLLTGAAVGALVTLSGAWSVLIESLNHAYDVEELRSWWHRRLLGLVLGVATVLVVAVTLAVIVVGPLLGHGGSVASWLGVSREFADVWRLVRLPVLFVLVVGWLAVVFRVAPNRRTRWRDALPGAFATTLLWLLSTTGFHGYLLLVGESNPLIGAFGGGVIVMSWAYLLCIALLLGGELNAILARHRRAW